MTLSALTLLATYRFARGELLPLAFFFFFFFSSLIEKSFSTDRIEIILLFRFLYASFISFFFNFFTQPYMSLISNFGYFQVYRVLPFHHRSNVNAAKLTWKVGNKTFAASSE